MMRDGTCATPGIGSRTLGAIGNELHAHVVKVSIEPGWRAGHGHIIISYLKKTSGHMRKLVVSDRPNWYCSLKKKIFRNFIQNKTMKDPSRPGDAAARGSAGRQLQAMILRRLHYDMRRYQIVNEYMARRRQSLVREAQSTKRRVEDASVVMVADAGARLDARLDEVHRDLESLRLDGAGEEPRRRTTKTSAFSDSPAFLKSFSDLF